MDDNAINREIISAYLKSWQCDPTVVSTGKAALAQLIRGAREGKPYDLLISDMMMPKMDGMELSRLIKKNKDLDSTRIIMLTYLWYPGGWRQNKGNRP